MVDFYCADRTMRPNRTWRKSRPPNAKSLSQNLLLSNLSLFRVRVSAAERIAVESGSVQVLNSSEACHWFDLPVFFKEVDRVLSPGGVVALSGYSRPIFADPTRSAELRHLIDQVTILLQSGSYVPRFTIISLHRWAKNHYINQFYDVHMASYRQAGSNEILNEYRNIKIPYEHNVRYSLLFPWQDRVTEQRILMLVFKIN